MTVEHHESAKTKEAVIAEFQKKFGKELGNLNMELNLNKKTKTSAIEWKNIPTETAKKVENIVNNEKPEAVKKASTDLLSYTNTKNRINGFQRAAEELAQNKNLTKTLDEITQKALEQGFNLDEDGLNSAFLLG